MHAATSFSAFTMMRRFRIPSCTTSASVAFGIGRTPSDSPDCASIVAGRGECLGHRAGDVLLDEEVHRGTG